MAAKGTVTTARGETLNLDDLIMRASRPIGVVDAASTVKKQVVPKATPINVRGHLPATATVPVPVVPEELKESIQAKPVWPTPPSSFRRADGKVAESLADLTGIRVDTPKHLRPELLDRLGISPREYAERNAVTEVLDQLERENPEARKAAKKADQKKKRTKNEETEENFDEE